MEEFWHELYPYPNGWYSIMVSSTLKNGDLVAKKFMGRDVVVFRTMSGKVCIMDAYCPHMGAHFAYGGTIEGETVRCPFHGFCFDTKGDCTKTGYGTKPPSNAKARTYPCEEVNGFILVYYHAEGKEPDWHIPEIDLEGWTPMKWIEYDLRSHPQETSENSVDIGHFSETHGYSKVEQLSEPVIDGPYLKVHYGMQRDSFMSSIMKPVRIQFQGHVHGLGYSFVETKVLNYGMETRHFVQSMPTEGDRIILRIGSSLKKVKKASDINPILSIIPKPILNSLISKAVFKGYKHDVSQDFDIWQNKKYVIRTPLAPGDGPIGMYRIWARQFYQEEHKPSIRKGLKTASV